LTVQFDASGSVDMDGKIVSYAWDFGDGKSGNGEKVSYKYKNFGTYLHRLKLLMTADRQAYTREDLCNKWRQPVTDYNSGADLYRTGEASIIQVTVKGKDGTPRSGVKVTLKSTGGNLAPDSGNTDPSGQFSSSFTAQEGTYRISATATQTGISQGSGETTVKVSVKRPLTVEIVPYCVHRVKWDIKHQGIVKGIDGKPVSDAFVTLNLILTGR